VKLILALLAFVAVFAAACGGGGDDSSSSKTKGVVIAAADADRVAHAGLPALTELPGENWQITGQDDFSDSSSNSDFLNMIQGTPECSTLKNLAALESVFGGQDTSEKAPIGQAQVEFSQQDPTALIPTSVNVEIKIDESSSGSAAQFQVVKDLFGIEGYWLRHGARRWRAHGLQHRHVGLWPRASHGNAALLLALR
jgi:hypothetical protein